MGYWSSRSCAGMPRSDAKVAAMVLYAGSPMVPSPARYTKRSPSFALEPKMTGTFAPCFRITSSGFSDSTSPSFSGPQLAPLPKNTPDLSGSALSNSSAVLPRRHSAAVASSVQPTACARSAPCCSDWASVGRSALHGPLSEIARWNSPWLPEEVRCAHTLTPPADSPKMVTFFGSPPKAATLSRTHSSAKRWSRRPKFLASPLRAGCTRNRGAPGGSSC